MNQTTIACDLPIEARDTRVDMVSAEIFTHATKIKELADGYEFYFSSDTAWIAKLVNFIQAESGCCGFFLFELVIRPNNNPISLRMRGEENVKSFLQQFGIQAQPEATTNEKS